MKKAITLLLCALSLSLAGCLPEGTEGCPATMTLTFTLEDKYEPSTYDQRIANDVLLYVFKDKKCVASKLIPYAEIKSGKEYVFLKTSETSGKLDLVAWAVPAGLQNSGLLPQWELGCMLDDQLIQEEVYDLSRGLYRSAEPELYMGRVSSIEAVDVATRHEVAMINSACRVEVNVTDTGTGLSTPGAEPAVVVRGSMNKMNMDKEGVGADALVPKRLVCPSMDGHHFTTDRFGVLPSKTGETITVDIYNVPQLIARLTIPKSSLPQGAQAGGLLIFDYVLGDAEFFVTIDGYRRNFVIIDGM